ncbi:MAG: magnesium transporter [Pseudomonadota bacterium]
MNEFVFGDGSVGLLRPLLSPATIAEALDAVRAKDAERLSKVIFSLHPADIADLLEQINRRDRRALLALLSQRLDGRVLSELEEHLRGEIIGLLDPDVAAEIVRDLQSDDQVDILEDLGREERARILAALGGPDRIRAESALSWPEDSAGRLMQHEAATVPLGWTVGEAIDDLRARPHVPEDFYHLVLMGEDGRPVGLVSLGRLLSSARETSLEEIAAPEFRTFPADLPEEEVAYIFNQYHEITVPVVDGDGKFVGIVTVDDAMTVLDEEHEEDMLKMGGVGEESSLSDGVMKTSQRRLPWLGVATVNSLVVAMTISIFEDAIEQLVALAILMPMVAAIGGAAGTQALTVAVRGLATRDLTGANQLRIIGRETLTGALNGAVLAVVLGLIALIWFGMTDLALVVGMAMAATITTAGLTGVCVPILLDKVGFDPALASGTFVTTAIDVLGFFTFLWLATVLIL